MNNTAQQPRPQLIPLSVAAKIVPLGERRLAVLCQKGEFKTAIQPGGKRGQWFINRDEVAERMISKHGE